MDCTTLEFDFNAKKSTQVSHHTFLNEILPNRHTPEKTLKPPSMEIV